MNTLQHTKITLKWKTLPGKLLRNFSFTRAKTLKKKKRSHRDFSYLKLRFYCACPFNHSSHIGLSLIAAVRAAELLNNDPYKA